MNKIIALDIGTTKIAAVVFDCENKTNIAVVSEINQATVSGLPAGRHEQCPLIILNQCMDLLRQLEEKYLPSAIAVTGQMHGVLLVDNELEPVTNLITWCDQRAVKLTDEIDRDNWPTERTGCYLHPGYGGATLTLLAQEHLIPSNAKALTIADFIVAKLSGVVASDPTHAASWGIMDIANNCWDAELLETLRIPPEILPEIKPSCKRLGTSKICVSIGDNQAGFIGACGFADKSLLLNLGTGGQISFPCDNIIIENEMEVRPLFDGRFLMVGASLCGGRSYALLKDFFKNTARAFGGTELSDSQIYGVMDSLALSATDRLGVDTRFAGTRMTPDTKGSISSITINNFTLANLCLGFIHGMIDELISMIPIDMISCFTSVMAGGNAVRKNPLAKQLISEKLGLECELTSVSEEAAAGAAMAAARKLGLL